MISLSSSPNRERVDPITIRTANSSLQIMGKRCVDTIRSFEETGCSGLSVRAVNKNEATGIKTKVFAIGSLIFEVFGKVKEGQLSGSLKVERKVNVYIWNYTDGKKDSIELKRYPIDCILFKNKNPIKSRDENNEFPFSREYRILESYKDTASVARVLGYFMYPEKKNGALTGRLREVIVMHRYRLDLLESIRNLTSIRLRETITQLVNVVAEMHRRGDIHRDLKLENFLVDIDGNIFLSDFGDVLQASDGQRCLALAGSPNNVAPECIKCCFAEQEIIQRWNSLPEKDRISHIPEKSRISIKRQNLWREAVQQANDVWSLGVIIYQLIERENNHGFPSSLNDAIFFKGKNPKIEEILMHRKNFNLASFPEPADKNSIEHLVWSMLNPNPAERITMADVLRKLRLIYAKKQDPLPMDSRGNSSFGAGSNSPVFLDQNRGSSNAFCQDNRQAGGSTSNTYIGSSTPLVGLHTPSPPRIPAVGFSNPSRQEGINNRQMVRPSPSPGGKLSHTDSRIELESLMPPIPMRGSSEVSNVYGMIQRPPSVNPVYY